MNTTASQHYSPLRKLKLPKGWDPNYGLYTTYTLHSPLYMSQVSLPLQMSTCICTDTQNWMERARSNIETIKYNDIDRNTRLALTDLAFASTIYGVARFTVGGRTVSRSSPIQKRLPTHAALYWEIYFQFSDPTLESSECEDYCVSMELVGTVPLRIARRNWTDHCRDGWVRGRCDF